MYTVGLNVNPQRAFSITVRDLDRSPHWKCVGDQIEDTRAVESKSFKIMYVGNTETDARKFAAVLEAAYLSVGYSKDFVKS